MKLFSVHHLLHIVMVHIIGAVVRGVLHDVLRDLLAVTANCGDTKYHENINNSATLGRNRKIFRVLETSEPAENSVTSRRIILLMAVKCQSLTYLLYDTDGCLEKNEELSTVPVVFRASWWGHWTQGRSEISSC